MLELAVAYIAVIIVLSTLVTAMIEMLARLTPMRRWWLSVALGRVLLQMRLCEGIVVAARQVAEFLKDPLVNPGKRHTFDNVEQAAVKVWLQAQLAATLAQQESLPEPERDAARIDTIRRHQGALETDFERWWQIFLDGQQRGYTSLTRALGFVMGVALCVVFRIDAISLAQHLWRSPTETTAWAELASGEDDSSSSAYPTTEPEDEKDLYFKALEDEVRYQVCGTAGPWSEWLEDPADSRLRWQQCEERVHPLLLQARAARPTDMDAEWEDAAWAVEQRLDMLLRLMEDTSGGSADASPLLARALQAAQTVDGDRAPADDLLSSERMFALLKLAPGSSPSDGIYDSALLFHLWDRCRAGCAQDGGGYEAACVLRAQACFSQGLPAVDSLSGGSLDGGADAGSSSDCAVCQDAMQNEVARILYQAQPGSWRDRFLAAFASGLSQPALEPAAHFWADLLLFRLGEPAGPADLVERLQSADLAAGLMSCHADLLLAREGAIEARQRYRYHDRYQMGFAGVERVRSPWARLLGYLLMAFLIALGAPFWFELLRYVNAARRMKEVPAVGEH